MTWTQDKISKNTEGLTYTKVVVGKNNKLGAGSKLKLSGAEGMWKTKPDMVYFPDVRLVGDYDEVRQYLTDSGFQNVDELTKFFYASNSYTQDGVKPSFDNEVAEIKSLRSPRSPAGTSSPKRKTTGSGKGKGKKKGKHLHQYGRLGVKKDGSLGVVSYLKLSGAPAMWTKMEKEGVDFIYVPSRKLAGSVADVYTFLEATENIGDEQVKKILESGYYNKGNIAEGGQMHDRYKKEVGTDKAYFKRKQNETAKKKGGSSPARKGKKGRKPGSTSPTRKATSPGSSSPSRKGRQLNRAQLEKVAHDDRVKAQYSKITAEGRRGKLRETGRDAMMLKHPEMVYEETYRLAGSQDDVRAFMRKAGVVPTI